MLDHVILNVRNLDRSRAFYEGALRPLGYSLATEWEAGAGFGTGEGATDFWISHRGVRVAHYPRSYEPGIWVPEPVLRAEPPAAPTPAEIAVPIVTPPPLADYAELSALARPRRRPATSRVSPPTPTNSPRAPRRSRRCSRPARSRARPPPSRRSGRSGRSSRRRRRTLRRKPASFATPPGPTTRPGPKPWSRSSARRPVAAATPRSASRRLRPPRAREPGGGRHGPLRLLEFVFVAHAASPCP